MTTTSETTTINRLFDLAEKAKQLGSYSIPNCIFAVLFEKSLDNPKIGYILESSDKMGISYFPEKLLGKGIIWGEASWSLYLDNSYDDLAVLNFKEKSLGIPMPKVTPMVGMFIAEKAMMYTDKRIHNRKYRRYVFERELESVLSEISLEVESLVGKTYIEKVALKHLSRGCPGCPYYYYANYDCLCMAGKVMEEPIHSSARFCPERLHWYVDSRDAFYRSTGRIA